MDAQSPSTHAHSPTQACLLPTIFCAQTTLKLCVLGPPKEPVLCQDCSLEAWLLEVRRCVQVLP